VNATVYKERKFVRITYETKDEEERLLKALSGCADNLTKRSAEL